MQDVCIVGVGNLGGALAIGLRRAGWNIGHLIVRSDRVARKIKNKFVPGAKISRIDGVTEITAPIVLITVDDPEIANAALSISGLVTKRQIVFHTSGSLSSSVLWALSERGASVGSLHPLASISDPVTGSEQLTGAYFCVEGDQKAAGLGRKIVRSLGGKPFSIAPDRKALYHAAAVTAAGHVTALFDAAVEMMSHSVLDESTAKRILLPLMQSAVSNLEKQHPADALTGTFARLDQEAFHRHLSSFDDLPRKLVHLYLELGERSLHLVEERDGTSKRLQSFRKAVSVAKQNYRC